MSRRSANREWTTAQEKKVCCGPKKKILKGVKRPESEEHFDVRHGDTQFEVCPAGLQSCVSPIFPCYAPFHVLE